MSDFFIGIFGKGDRRRLVIGPGGTDSSTEIRPPSRASRRVAARLRFCLFGILVLGRLSLAVAAISLSHPEAVKVGRQIWQNECAGTVAGLTSWNEGEAFASLGIGHFIWYPAGHGGPFEESFPPLLSYARKRGAKLPEWLIPPDVACPWRSRAEFLAASSSKPMLQLRHFLEDTIDLQADFLVLRLQAALPKMLHAVPARQRATIESNFNRVVSSAHGCYALVDYVNFKGEGVLASERYHEKGWGLLQVLAGMSGAGGSDAATREFAESARAVLRERVNNSPPQRREARWLPGWLNRIATYANH